VTGKINVSSGNDDVWVAKFVISQTPPVPGGGAGVSTATLSNVKSYPNPLRFSLGQSAMTFSNLPSDASLKVYTLRGELVRELTPGGSGTASWDGKNQSGEKAASGVYFVFVQGAGDKKTMKVAIQR
jgi:hypothetical protein